jgi:hypothetical protein
VAVTIGREVTTIDQRTARRLGMNAEKVNDVIRVWAEEYLRFEKENGGWEGSVQQQALAKPAAKSSKSRTTRPKPPTTQAEAEAEPEGNPS